MNAYDVFIAYETASGKCRAEFIKKNLEKIGIHVFEAQTDLEIGKDWKQGRDKALEESSYFVVIVTSMVVFSKEFKLEFEYAYGKRDQKTIVLCVEKDTKTDIVYKIFPQMTKIQRVKSFSNTDELMSSVVNVLMESNDMLIKMLTVSNTKLQWKKEETDIIINHDNENENSPLQKLSNIFDTYQNHDELKDDFLDIFRGKAKKKEN